MAPTSSNNNFEPYDALSRAIQAGTWTGLVGLTIAATRNALEVKNVGPWHTFRKGGKLIFTLGSTGAVYEFTHCASANLRQKKDHWNHFLAGLFGGAVFGLGSPVRSMPRVLGYGALFSVVMGAFDLAGGSLSGGPRLSADEKYEMREMQRTRYRQPIEETVAYLGLGKEIKPPGYEEFRKKKIEEKYGVKIQTWSANPDDYPNDD